LRRAKVEDAVLYYEPTIPGRGRRMEFGGKDIPEEKTSRTEWTRADTAQGRIGGNGTNQLFNLPFSAGNRRLFSLQWNSVFGRYFSHITSPRHSCTLSCLVKKVYFYFFGSPHCEGNNGKMEIRANCSFFFSCKLFFEQGLALGLFR